MIRKLSLRPLYCALAMCFVAESHAAVTPVFSNDYSDAGQAANYGVDRANPGGFTVNEGGDGNLTIDVLATDASNQTGSFYNFHGISTGPAGDFNVAKGGSVSVDLYVPSSWDGDTAKRGGDLWIRIEDPTEPDKGQHYYPSIGVYNYADGNGALVSMFSATSSGMDATGGSFYDRYDVPINFDAYNELGFRFNVDGSVDYIFNGIVVGTDTDPGYIIAGNLQQVYLQGWQGDVDYDATFDNLVVIPEPASLALLGLGSLLMLRRRAQ